MGGSCNGTQSEIAYEADLPLLRAWLRNRMRLCGCEKDRGNLRSHRTNVYNLASKVKDGVINCH